MRILTISKDLSPENFDLKQRNLDHLLSYLACIFAQDNTSDFEANLFKKCDALEDFYTKNLMKKMEDLGINNEAKDISILKKDPKYHLIEDDLKFLDFCSSKSSGSINLDREDYLPLDDEEKHFISELEKDPTIKSMVFIKNKTFKIYKLKAKKDAKANGKTKANANMLQHISLSFYFNIEEDESDERMKRLISLLTTLVQEYTPQYQESFIWYKNFFKVMTLVLYLVVILFSLFLFLR